MHVIGVGVVVVRGHDHLEELAPHGLADDPAEERAALMPRMPLMLLGRLPPRFRRVARGRAAAGTWRLSSSPAKRPCVVGGGGQIFDVLGGPVRT